MNELVLQTLQKISEESFMINNANIEVFRGYIETLCYMYLDKSLKQYSFEMILNLLAKIMKEMDIINEEKDKEYEKYVAEKKITNGIVTQDTEYIRKLYQELSRDHRI